MLSKALGLVLVLVFSCVGLVSGGCCAECMNTCKLRGFPYQTCLVQICNTQCTAPTPIGVAGQYVDCLSMTVKTCPTGTYSATWSVDNTASSCVPCTVCPSTSFAKAVCTSTTNAQCQACTVCPSTSFTRVACTSTADAQCQACTMCGIGKATNSPCSGTADATCLDCSAGTYGVLTSITTTIGGLSTTTDAYGCMACDYGTYQPLSGQSSCLTCNAPCVLGQYMVSDCSGTTNRVCGACTSFSTGSTPTSYSCDGCLAGYYLKPVLLVFTACTACGAVQAEPTSYCAQGSYITCPARGKTVTCMYCTGYPAPGPGNCAAGLEPNMVCDGMKMVDTQCAQCKPGFAKPDASTTWCAPCTAGLYTAINGSLTCGKCNAMVGFYSGAGQSACTR